MADSIPQLLERSPEEGARFVVLQRLDAAVLAARRLSDKRDEKALHAFRTSLRRTRSLLKAYRAVLGSGARKCERALKKVADLTGAGRDAEVQLAWLERELDGEPAVAPLRKRLERQRDKGYRRARSEAREAFAGVQRALRRSLLRYEKELDPQGEPRRTFARETANVLRSLVAEVGDKLAEGFADAAAVSNAEVDAEALHAARIRVKRLRYVLEALGEEVRHAAPIIERVKTLQDLLGEIHDLQVMLQLVEAEAARARRRANGSKKQGSRRAKRPTSERAWSGEPVRARAQARLDERVDALRGEWCKTGWPAVAADVEALATALSTDSKRATATPMEIERKYLLDALPSRAKKVAPKELWQGWIPGERLQERLRRVKQGGRETFFRTVKLGRGLARVEIEEEAPRELFEKLWPLTEGRRVLKQRYAVADGAFTWEIDAFSDRDLFLAEVELPSEDADAPPPKWLAPHIVREVTGEDEYVNINLAR